MNKLSSDVTNGHPAWLMTINVIEQGPSMYKGLSHTKLGQQRPTYTHIYDHHAGQSVENFSIPMPEPTQQL